jgi:MFS transporter, DHA1 family, multidrug resistance protein
MASSGGDQAASAILPRDSTRSADRRLLGLLGLLTATEVTAIDICMPALPQMQKAMQVSPSQAAFIISIFLAGLAFGQAVYGPLSDRYGRRPPLLIGLVVFMAGSALPIVASTFAWLLLARLLQALGAAAGIVIPRAIIADRFEGQEAERAFSILMQLLGVAAVLAPLLGGFLVTVWGWRSVFWALTALGIFALVLVAGTLVETLPESRRASGSLRGQFGSLVGIARDLPFLCYSLALASAIAAMFAVLTGSSFIFIKQYSWSPQAYSALYAAGALGFVVLGVANTRALRSVSAAWLLWRAVWVQALLALGLILLTSVASPPALLAATLMALLLSNLGFVIGNLNAVAMSRARNAAGLAASILGVSQYAASALAGPVAAGVGGSPLHSSAYTTTAFCAVSLACCIIAARLRPTSPESREA